MAISQEVSEGGGETAPRLLIKRTARRLIAERGARNVSVREIALAAHQRNLGVVAYYFGTKDALIAEILTDGAERIEALRTAHLDALEAKGGPTSVLEAVEAIVAPSAAFSDNDPVYGEAFNRFLLQLSLSSEALIDRTLAGRWNAGYQRCLAHLRTLTPGLTRSEQGRRFLFLGSYLAGVLAAREAAMADADREHRMWRSRETLDDIVRTAAALITASV